MYGLAVSLIISLHALSSFALPTPRNGSQVSTQDPTQSLQQFMQAALSTYLASQGVNRTFSALDSWQPVSTTGTSQELVNNALFELTDQQVNLANQKGPSVSFSTLYVEFIQQLTKAVGSNAVSKQQQTAIEQRKNAWMIACQQNLPQELNSVAASYVETTGVPPKSKSDPDLLQYAATDPSYGQAQDECQAAYTAYQGALASAYGVDNAVYQAAINNVAGIINPTTALPGVTMAVQSGFTSGSKFGMFKPYYAMPLLNSTMQAWQQQSSKDYDFTYSSASESGSSSNTTTQGGGGFHFAWERILASADASASGSKTTTSSNVQAKSMVVKLRKVGLMSIDHGIWLLPEVATPFMTKQSPDKITQEFQPTFNKYYGTADKPGPLASYKVEALVVYQPYILLDFETAEQASSTAQVAASGSFCFIFICAGGNGGKTTTQVSYQKGSTQVEIGDQSQNVRIAGYNYQFAWAPESQSTLQAS